MALEQDAARDGKKTGLVIVLGLAAVAAGIYLVVGWLNRPPPADSSYDIGRVASNAAVDSPETARYRRQMHDADRHQATQAEQNGSSYIASISEATTTAPEAALAPPPVSLDTTPAPVVTPVSDVSDDRKEALKGYLKTLSTRWRPGSVQLADSFGQSDARGGGNGNGGGSQDNAFAGWSQSLPGHAPVVQTVSTSTGTPADSPPAQMIVAPGARPGAVMDSAVDSDNLNSIVLAHIPAGPLAGATLTAQGIRLAGDGVTIHFTQMTLNGTGYNIDAWALTDDTLQSSVATDVSHRYFSRIILPAIADGIGNVGQLYKDQNTQILSTNAGTITGGTGDVKGSAVAGTIIGGIGASAGQVMTNDASHLPATQVRINQNQVIAVLFMKGVYDTDRTVKTPVITSSTTGAH
ncbi:conjugal transfer protein TraO [Klebsiella michiganensis]|uniref:conjugal transfer protein TraO n=1 Tax=Klebsiella michiganensis TaxID=1134687 RepID=UPI003F509328